MAIEVVNSLHAMAFVRTDPGQFIGQGNVGFAAFGPGLDGSLRVSQGTVRLRLIDPVGLTTGEAVIISSVLNQNKSVANIFIPAGETRDIEVINFVGEQIMDVDFMIVVLRIPQHSTVAST